MNSTAKKILAFFLLAVFAFPFIQKEIHNHEHSGDVHCTAKDQKHFHEQEHNCSICDFTTPASEEASAPSIVSVSDSASFQYQDLTQQIVYFFVERFFLQRAPPASAQ